MRATDQELLDRLVEGSDANAFTQVVTRHADMVFTTCWRILRDEARAAEVVQDTFFQLFKHGARITDCLGGWLHRVATRRAIDVVRQDVSRQKREAIYAADFGAPHGSWAEVEPLVDLALDALDDDLREVLTMHFLEQKSMCQIAAAKGLSQPTISRRIAAGLEGMREQLRKMGVAVGVVPLQSLLVNGRMLVPEAVLRKLGKMALAQAAASKSGALAGAGLKAACGVGAAVLVAGAVWVLWPVAEALPPDLGPGPAPALQAQMVNAETGSAPEAWQEPVDDPEEPIVTAASGGVAVPKTAVLSTPAVAVTAPRPMLVPTNAVGPNNGRASYLPPVYAGVPTTYGGVRTPRMPTMRMPTVTTQATVGFQVNPPPGQGVMIVNFNTPNATFRGGGGSVVGPPMVIQGGGRRVPSSDPGQPSRRVRR